MTNTVKPADRTVAPVVTTCCGGDDHVAPATASLPAAAAGTAVFRIATMDCASEEGEIRRALEPLPGIRSLSFQLGARTLAIDADAQHLPQALAAIRKVGFDPQPLAAAGEPKGHADGAHDHAHGDHDHDEGHEHGAESGIKRLGAALGLAVAAEALSYFAPALLTWQLAGMAVAGVAIWLAGLDTYKKGLNALRRGRLNINALMSVAVTGAFVLGQWPEAAMVMALYAIAELIEARSVDRARNAIKGLMALAPQAAESRQEDGTCLGVPRSGVAIDSIIRI